MKKPNAQQPPSGAHLKTSLRKFAASSPDQQHHYVNLLVKLMNEVLQAGTVNDAIQPILDAFMAHSSAQGAFYLKAEQAPPSTLGEVVQPSMFAVWDSVGRPPQGPTIRDALNHGVPQQDTFVTELLDCSPVLIVDNTAAQASTSVFIPLGIGSLVAAPVYTYKQVLVGVFVVYHEHTHAWTQQERALFRAISMTPTALAARFVNQQHTKYTYEDALHALGLVLEHCDDDTKGHTDRVTQLSLRIANAMTLDDDACDAMRRGAYLHDVGKIAIPDTILRKPAKLDETEWELMRTHTMIGYEFTQNLTFLPEASQDVVLYHHEKYDGTGYPYGLQGEDIPLLARIFSVADVYDALVSVRPYKPAWQHSEAMTEIHDMSGHHFDPQVVTVFETLF